MKKNNKEAIKVLGGIDSFYFFVDTSKLNNQLYKSLYENELKNCVCSIANMKSLGYSGKTKGFVGSWFEVFENDRDIPLFRIGFKDPEKQNNVNNIYIQLNGSGIYLLGFSGLLDYIKNWLSCLLECKINLNDFICSRVDINCFINGFDFSGINANMFHSSFLKVDTVKTFGFCRDRLETLYLGSRNGKFNFKIYDKRLELFKTLNSVGSKLKISFLQSKGFDFSSEIWNAEFSLKREFLKEFKTFNAFDLLNNFYSIYKYLFSKLRFLGFDLNKIKKYKSSNSLNKYNTALIWEFIQDCSNFSVKINKNVFIKREVKKYASDIENYAYKIISSQVKKLVMQGIEINLDRYLKIANL